MIRTIVEAILVVIIFVGIFNESKIADFEQAVFNKLRRSKKQ